MKRSGLVWMPVTGSRVRASRNVAGPLGTGCTTSTRSPTATCSASAAVRAMISPARPAGRPPLWNVGCQSGRSSATVSSATSSLRRPAISVEASRSEGWAAPTLASSATRRTPALPALWGAVRSTVRRLVEPASASWRLVWSVRSKESMVPDMARTSVTIAPMPSSVSSVRRGVRRTLRSGRLASAPPGSRRPLTSHARPLLRAALAPTRMASTGTTRTARHTGRAAASSGSPARARRPAGRGPPGSSSRTTGSGKNSFMIAAQPLAGGEPDGDPQRHAGERDLRAEQERAPRERAWLDPEGHADPDLAPLRLDRAADQVERRKRRRAEHQHGEDVEHLLVALGVLVDHPVRGLVVARREREPRVRQRGLQRPAELGADGGRIGAVAQSQHELIDRPACPERAWAVASGAKTTANADRRRSRRRAPSRRSTRAPGPARCTRRAGRPPA